MRKWLHDQHSTSRHEKSERHSGAQFPWQPSAQGNGAPVRSLVPTAISTRAEKCWKASRLSPATNWVFGKRAATAIPLIRGWKNGTPEQGRERRTFSTSTSKLDEKTRVDCVRARFISVSTPVLRCFSGASSRSSRRRETVEDGQGMGGQPGMKRSRGTMFPALPLCWSWLEERLRRSMAQAPTAMARRGSGTAAQVFCGPVPCPWSRGR